MVPLGLATVTCGMNLGEPMVEGRVRAREPGLPGVPGPSLLPALALTPDDWRLMRR